MPLNNELDVIPAAEQFIRTDDTLLDSILFTFDQRQRHTYCSLVFFFLAFPILEIHDSVFLDHPPLAPAHLAPDMARD